ncbi:hypothetical protein [Stigmatella aurantiaca]|uniref:Uncharacterized protein n=1 Tax=Stigmatella aurantiaca (strain DW4/3-1) TaxID=378806 RepID=Q099C0_STIAD|nr:hypothetical protein [Stigmatella aurantiaca]EAU68330.1 hypothetical protein STIAU_3944 [Stigmatella aurantiaca DW4/3-1]
MQLESLRLSTLLMVTQLELLQAREALDGSQEAWLRLQAVSARATAAQEIAEELLCYGSPPTSRV